MRQLYDSGADTRRAKEIPKRIGEIYHLSPEEAEAALEKSAVYNLIIDPGSKLWRDGAEKNFLRYQNEIEYGAWNRNETGGIAE